MQVKLSSAQVWCWFSLKDDKLIILKQKCVYPLINDMKPMATSATFGRVILDLDYKNKRPVYLENFFDKLINWDFVESSPLKNSFKTVKIFFFQELS